MKYKLEAKIDELKFAIFDEANEEIIDKPDEIAAFLADLSTKKAIAVLADSLGMFCEELKTMVKEDLADCYRESK